jgi:hypothetical protein
MDGTTFDTHAGRTAQQHALSFAEAMVRGAARMLELQTSATRAVLQMQGRNAAMFGVPDWSGLFDGRSAEQLESLFHTSADQTVHFLRSANETLQQVQQQFGQLMERQTQQVAEQMRRSLEEMTRRSREGMEQFTRASDEALQRSQRAGEDLGRELQRTQEATAAASSPIIASGSEPVSSGIEDRSRSRRSA